MIYADGETPTVRSGPRARPLCCPDTDTLWFPGGMREAIVYLRRNGFPDADEQSIYYAIYEGTEYGGHTWDIADLDARRRHGWGRSEHLTTRFWTGARPVS